MKAKNQYCRACGKNKGHSFRQCSNARGLREIIANQDAELSATAERLERLEGELREVRPVAENTQFLYRVAVALLDAREAS